MTELSFSIHVVRSLADGMKKKSGARTPHSINPTACCHSFDSSHSWFEYSLIPTSEPFHIAHADSEIRPTAMRNGSFDPRHLRYPRFPRFFMPTTYCHSFNSSHSWLEFLATKTGTLIFNDKDQCSVPSASASISTS